MILSTYFPVHSGLHLHQWVAYTSIINYLLTFYLWIQLSVASTLLTDTIKVNKPIINISMILDDTVLLSFQYKYRQWRSSTHILRYDLIILTLQPGLSSVIVG